MIVSDPSDPSSVWYILTPKPFECETTFLHTPRNYKNIWKDNTLAAADAGLPTQEDMGGIWSEIICQFSAKCQHVLNDTLSSRTEPKM